MMVILIISIFSSCGNKISNANLLKIEKSLKESIEQLKTQNLMLEYTIRNEIWDRNYSLYDTIEVIMDDILDEFVEIEDHVKEKFPSNCQEDIPNKTIEEFVNMYSFKINKILFIYSNFLRTNHDKYELTSNEIDEYINEFGQSWNEDLTGASSYLHRKENVSCDFRLLFLMGDILKQENEILSRLNTLIKRPCFSFEIHYPIVINGCQIYDFNKEAITEIALGTYFGGTEKNTELFVNGEQIEEYIDGVFYYDLPTDKKGKQELLLKIIKKDAFNDFADTSLSTFVYEVQ